MTSDERKALADALCEDCGGLLKLPDAPVPAALLRWCLCVFEELSEEKQREPMGFGVKSKKGKD